jgi:hypothetical protein
MSSSSEGARAWIRPALFFLAVSVAATAIAVAVALAQDSSGNPSSPPTVSTATTATVPTTTTTETTTATTTTATTTTTTTTTPRPAPGGLETWPAGTSGYTAVLESIPLSAGRAFAVSRARAARRASLPQVGVLVSSRYASLRPGYYVVFSGVYPSSARAAAALPAVHAGGFPDAYQARVSRNG